MALAALGRRTVATLVVLGGLAPLPALAQSGTTPARPPVPVVIVVDAQAALQQSVAAKAIRAERDRLLQTYQAELDATRKSLKDTENQLIKEKTTMPAEAWQTKARAFEHQVFEFNQKFQKSNQAVEKSFRTAMGELSKALAQVTEDVAGEVGANLVLHKMQVFLHDPRMEVTQTVVERLNAKFPSVEFPPPAVEPIAPSPKAPVKKGK